MPRPFYPALALLLSLVACTPPTDPANRPPTISAGEDQIIFEPTENIPLSGTASDPDGDTLSATWSQSSGPEGVTFADETVLTTTATFPGVGLYTLTLSVTDGAARVSDDLSVTVEPESPGTTGSWEQLPPSSEARQEVAYVQLGGKFYLAGGGARNGGYGMTARHEVYDPATQTWAQLSPLPTALDHIQGVAWGGRIYYIGGLSGWPGPHADTVYIYDPETDSFTEGTPMPRGRGAGGVAVHNGLIYYAGGLYTDASGTTVVPWLDVYDPEADAWTLLPDMPHARDHFHAAVLDRTFYAIGGRQETANATIPEVDAFDLTSRSWTTLDTELPTERGGFASAVVGGEILVIGGEGGGNTFDTVEAYNPETNSWRTLAPMPTARHGIQAAVCGNGVYIAAGGTVQGVGPSTAHEALFLGSSEGNCAAD